jgi:hypothetical protein
VPDAECAGDHLVRSVLEELAIVDVRDVQAASGPENVFRRNANVEPAGA